MSNERKVYPKEYKDEIIQFLRSSGKTISQVAKEFSLRPDLVSRWNREYDEKNAFPGLGNPRDKELYDMKKRIKELEEERDILKKAMAIFSQQK